jgi:hypothetical protein
MATRRQQITRSAAVKNAEEKNGQTSPLLPRKQESKNQEGKNREGECLWRLAGGKKKTRSAALKNAAEESTTMKTREQTQEEGRSKMPAKPRTKKRGA